MLLLQTDHLVMELNVVPTTKQIPLTIVVQCNGKIKRSLHYLYLNSWEHPQSSPAMMSSHSTSLCDIDQKRYDLNEYSYATLSAVVSLLKSLGYDIDIDENELRRDIVQAYIHEVVCPPHEGNLVNRP